MVLELSIAVPIASGQQPTVLFDGLSLSGWKVEGTTANADAGVLTVQSGPGWVRYERPLADFRLTMQMRLIGAGARGGVYVRAWPTFDKKTELPDNGYSVSVTKNAAPGQSSEAVSQWQRVEVVCSGSTFTVRIDEREVFTRDDMRNPQGFVALSVQGGTAEFRAIELTRPPRGSSPQRPAREGVFRPGGAVQLPSPLREVKPQYTADAMKAKISGGVLLEAVVLEDGTVGAVDILQSLDPHFGLDESAIASAKQWRFRPGTRDGTPVAVLVTIELTFTLR
jgi:TonB family protein